MKTEPTRYDALARSVRKVSTYAKNAALETAELMEGLIVGTLPAPVQEVIAEIHYGNEEKNEKEIETYAAAGSRISIAVELVGGATATVFGMGGPLTLYGASLLFDGFARTCLRADNEPLGSLPLEIPFDIVGAAIGYCVDTIKTSKKMMRGEFTEYTDCGGGGILD